MTVSYQLDVANATFAGFPKLLMRWKASVYKLMFREFLLFSFCYTLLSLVYRLALDEDQKRTFERLCVHIEETISHVPLTFVLGFYVTFVVSRWWEQLVSYPWPDKLLYLIIFYINGTDEKSLMYRRQLARYLQATTILLTRTLSTVCKKRFPSLEHMVEAGLFTKEELQKMNDIKLQYGKFWVPFVWFTQTLEQARSEGLINDPVGAGVKQILDEMLNFRGLIGKMFAYDWVSIPISYTQVVTLAVYTYFLGCIFSRQFLDPAQKYKGHSFDMFVPIFTILQLVKIPIMIRISFQFVFYVGWLKVAEALINPWGEDDDDFEVNWFIDRHTQVSYCIVDDMHTQKPTLVKDKYWGIPEVQMPYTIASVDNKRDSGLADLGSTMEFVVPLSQQRMSISGPPSSSRRPSSVGSAVGIPIHANGIPRMSKQWEIPAISSAFRRKSSTLLGGKDVHWQLPTKDSMGIIEESPASSEKDSFLPPGRSTGVQVPSLVSSNEYFFPKSTGTQAPSVISDSGSDVVSSIGHAFKPSSPKSVPYIDQARPRPTRSWQMRRDSRDRIYHATGTSPERRGILRPTSRERSKTAPIADASIVFGYSK